MNDRKSVLTIVSSILIILAILIFIYYLIFLRPYVTTDDAYVAGDKIAVSSQISGRTIAIYVDNADFVVKGQRLALLDPTDYDLMLQKSKEQLADAVREVNQLKHQVEELKAQLIVRQAERKQAEYDFRNRQSLSSIEAVSNEEIETTNTRFQATDEQVRIAENQLAAAQTLLGSGPIETNPKVMLAKNSLRLSYLSRLRCDVIAPISGYVAQRSVQVGEAVDPSRPLLAIVPLERMWIEANYKETELRDVRVGQPAEVTVDLYGSGVVFKGKVAGMFPGTGAAFSLLPPQNASGNWIKIVQRIPTRIVLDEETIKKYPLRLGLSCHASVRITNTEGPYYPERPSLKPIAVTPVYEISFESIDQEIEQIIRENGSTQSP